MTRTTLKPVVSVFRRGYYESVPSEQHKTAAEAPGPIIKKTYHSKCQIGKGYKYHEKNGIDMFFEFCKHEFIL
jgi:hypothetical protein